MTGSNEGGGWPGGSWSKVTTVGLAPPGGGSPAEARMGTAESARSKPIRFIWSPPLRSTELPADADEAEGKNDIGEHDEHGSPRPLQDQRVAGILGLLPVRQ